MCVLWLIGLAVLGVAFSPFIGLLFGVGVVLNAVQKKPGDEGSPRSEPEFNRPLAIRVAVVALLMLGAFLLFLLVRFWTT